MKAGRGSWVRGLVVGSLSSLGIALPSYGADQVYVDLGFLGVPVEVQTLEEFAATGQIATQAVSRYVDRLSAEDQALFRQVLETDVQLDALMVSQFLNSPMGSELLHYVGELVQTGDRRNGADAIQTALTAAAEDSQGMNLLKILEEFPDQRVYLDGGKILGVARQISAVIQSTNTLVSQLNQISQTQAQAQSPFDFDTYPSLQEPGTLSWQQQTLTLIDANREAVLGTNSTAGRVVVTDLYVPDVPASANSQSLPLVIISHGLSSNRQAFASLAEHLASYGLAVAVIEHPGSNSTYQQALFRGETDDMFRAQEFVDRPLDATFVLDELERLSKAGELTTASGTPIPLNLEKVGVIGHSFGGYTALALAGAPIDLTYLRETCDVDANYLNISLVLQCRALEISGPMDLGDDRVAAIVPVNPVASAVLGPTSIRQIAIPVLIAAGSEDPIAPILLEQVRIFTWLQGNDHYLGVSRGATHISNFGALQEALIPSLSALLDLDLQIYRSYFRAFAVAFMQYYVGDRADYQPYLQASYGAAISRRPFNLSFVDSRAIPTLSQALE